MQKLCVFKDGEYYIGIFSNAGQNQNVYELPLIRLVSHFFRDTTLYNVLFVKSLDYNQANSGRGIIIGELDALVLDTNDRLIFPIEIKNCNIISLDKKLHILNTLIRYIARWQYIETRKQIYTNFLPIWLYRASIPESIKMILINSRVLPLSLVDIKGYINKLPFLMQKDVKLIRSHTLSEIPETSGLHKLIKAKIKSEMLRSVDKLFSHTNFVKQNCTPLQVVNNAEKNKKNREYEVFIVIPQIDVVN
jgi:hypothetical protein